MNAAGRRRSFPEPLALILARGTRVRCTHRSAPGKPACDARRTLSKPLEQYTRLPACRVCGARKYRVDVSRSLERGRYSKKPCNCGEYPFPHRCRSLWCASNRANWPQVERDMASSGWTPRR